MYCITVTRNELDYLAALPCYDESGIDSEN